jgi:hypothetical protein
LTPKERFFKNKPQTAPQSQKNKKMRLKSPENEPFGASDEKKIEKKFDRDLQVRKIAVTSHPYSERQYKTEKQNTSKSNFVATF